MLSQCCPTFGGALWRFSTRSNRRPRSQKIAFITVSLKPYFEVLLGRTLFTPLHEAWNDYCNAQERKGAYRYPTQKCWLARPDFPRAQTRSDVVLDHVRRMDRVRERRDSSGGNGSVSTCLHCRSSWSSLASRKRRLNMDGTLFTETPYRRCVHRTLAISRAMDRSASTVRKAGMTMRTHAWSFRSATSPSEHADPSKPRRSRITSTTCNFCVGHHPVKGDRPHAASLRRERGIRRVTLSGVDRMRRYEHAREPLNEQLRGPGADRRPLPCGCAPSASSSASLEAVSASRRYARSPSRTERALTGQS